MTIDDATHLRRKLERFEAHAWRVRPQVRQQVRDLYRDKLRALGEELEPEPFLELPAVVEIEEAVAFVPLLVRPVLLLSEGTADEEVLPVADEVHLGRARTCDVQIMNDTKVSRVHARLFERADGWAIEDLNSANGTLVNGEMLDDRVARRLFGNEELILGETFLRFRLIPEV